MIVGLQVGTPARGWHRRLAARIEADGHRVVMRRVASRSARGAGFILAVERRLYGAVAHGFEPLAIARVAEACDVLIAIEGEGATLDLLFDEERGEAALVGALLGGRAPLVRVRGDHGVLAAGLPAVEDPHILGRALAQVLVRVEDLIVQALRRMNVAAGALPTAREVVASKSPPGFLARGLAAKLARRLGPARGCPDHWRVATRAAGTGEAFAIVPDDGERFYADPFPFEWDGRRFLFFEDYAYRTGKGVIGCVAVDEAGRASPPRRVLEQPVHLSYPFVFRDGDAAYMLPEMGAARRVQLFRAVSFPDRWMPDQVLLDDVVAADATLIRHGGAWWLFATLAGDGGSSWDKLCLFHAPSLAGPWLPHADNPVLIDAGGARPAGAMWHEGEVLMRVAQDCRRGYGDAVALCRVDRLDPAGFRQTVVARMVAPTGFGADGTHTWNRSAGLEVIDLRFQRAPRP